MSTIALIGKKLGMSAAYQKNGTVVPLTAISVGKNVLLRVKNKKSDGYDALVIGSGVVAKEKRVSKPQLKNFEKAGVKPRTKQKEFRISNENIPSELPVTEFSVNAGMVGAFVDVSGITKGKGFQGGMKRWGFAGLRASHGVSVSHRSIGSTGNRTEPGRVFKGKKMPGHMGCDLKTSQNLLVHSVDEENGIMFVVGSFPGGKNSYVYVKNSVKKPILDSQALNGVQLGEIKKEVSQGINSDVN